MLYPWPEYLGCGEDAGKGELKHGNAGLDAAIAGVWEVANFWETTVFRLLYILEYNIFVH